MLCRAPAKAAPEPRRGHWSPPLPQPCIQSGERAMKLCTLRTANYRICAARKSGQGALGASQCVSPWVLRCREHKEHTQLSSFKTQGLSYILVVPHGVTGSARWSTYSTPSCYSTMPTLCVNSIYAKGRGPKTASGSPNEDAGAWTGAWCQGPAAL